MRSGRARRRGRRSDRPARARTRCGRAAPRSCARARASRPRGSGRSGGRARSVFTSAVTTSTFGWPRASITSRCVREFETATIGRARVPLGEPAGQRAPAAAEVEQRHSVRDAGALARQREHRLLRSGQRVARPSGQRHELYFRRGPRTSRKKSRRHLVVLLVRLLDPLRDLEPRRRSTNACFAAGPPRRCSAQARRTRGANCRAQDRVGHPARLDQAVDERFRKPWHEDGRLPLVAAVRVAARAQRRLLRGRDAGDEEDEVENERRREEGDPAPRRRGRDQRVGDPRQRLEEVVRMARVAPQAGAHDAAPVGRIGAEGRELSVGRRLERERRQPQRSAEPLNRRDRRVLVERREQRRHREQRGDERLRLIEDREAELLVAAFAPAPAQLLVAPVLAVAEALAHERSDPKVLERDRDRDQEPLRESARREERVEHGAHGDRRAPARVDCGRVSRPALDEIEHERAAARESAQPSSQQLPARHAPSRSLNARVSVSCTSRSARVRKAASQNAR